MIASIYIILQTKHQKMTTTKKIMDSLEKLFSKGTHQARQAVMCSIMSTEMKRGTNVCDHVLHVKLLNEANVQRAKIDEDT